MATPVFRYSHDDLVAEIALEKECREECSEFDKELRFRWDAAVEKGYFRYTIDDLPTRVVDGVHGFVAQLNVKRGTDRRKPQEIKSTKQPFKTEEFNFNKIKVHEIIMELCPESSTNYTPVENPGSCMTNGTESDADQRIENGRRGRVQVVINISPLEYGNVLLVPSPEACLPQIATLEMIQIGVEALFLSSSRAFRVGYNSLCAFASVNHLHMHAYYVQHRLPSEYLASREIVRGRCHESVGYPAQTFMLTARKENCQDVIRDLYTIVRLFQDKDIAHNMFFTRGWTAGPNPDDDGQTIRLLLWPRKSSYGAKASISFNGACCELGGHLPMKFEERYHSLTDGECCDLLMSDSLPADQFDSLRRDVQNLFPE